MHRTSKDSGLNALVPLIVGSIEQNDHYPVGVLLLDTTEEAVDYSSFDGTQLPALSSKTGASVRTRRRIMLTRRLNVS